MDDWRLRTEMLLGREALERLEAAHVAVLGLGGVGSFAAEGLARAGVGRLTLVDHDAVGPTNLNRQLIALTSTVGRPKAEVMARRARDINPRCEARPMVMRYGADNREAFFAGRYDYILDAIDLVSCKLDLIGEALERSIPILSALGTGNKTDSSLLRISDISETFGCRLARVVRKELRARGIEHTRVLWSPEPPIRPLALDSPPPGRRSVPASVCWVPGCAGLMMAGEAVMALASGGAAPPGGRG